jgi:hypothetical protein
LETGLEGIVYRFEEKYAFKKRRMEEKRVISVQEQCAEALNTMNFFLYSGPYDQMFIFSGKDINDLGSPDK